MRHIYPAENGGGSPVFGKKNALLFASEDPSDALQHATYESPRSRVSTPRMQPPRAVLITENAVREFEDYISRLARCAGNAVIDLVARRDTTQPPIPPVCV